jgi:hypothetical protein
MRFMGDNYELMALLQQGMWIRAPELIYDAIRLGTEQLDIYNLTLSATKLFQKIKKITNSFN